jgi:hypothetical protein
VKARRAWTVLTQATARQGGLAGWSWHLGLGQLGAAGQILAYFGLDLIELDLKRAGLQPPQQRLAEHCSDGLPQEDHDRHHTGWPRQRVNQ